MAFTIPEFEPYKRGNPLASALSGYVTGKQAYQEYQKNLLANQLAQKKLPYAEEDIKTILENRRQEIELKKMKLSHPELFYPPDIQSLTYLLRNRPQLSQGAPTPEKKENMPSMGNMTLLSGADFSPQQQLAGGLARSPANAPSVSSATGTQELDINDPYIAALSQYIPGLKQQIATQLAEQKGQAAGVEEQGRKLGGYRADAIKEMDDQYGSLLQTGASIDHLVDLTKDPVFMNLKKEFPFFQDKQLQVISKLGTPEEQQAIGDFFSTVGNTITSAVQSFKGSALEKEFELENQMNVGPNDTWNAMVGKLESLETFKELIKRRNRAAVKLMQEKHLNKGDALEEADRLVDGNKIREEIREKLKPKRTINGVTYHKVGGKWLPVVGENNA